MPLPRGGGSGGDFSGHSLGRGTTRLGGARWGTEGVGGSSEVGGACGCSSTRVAQLYGVISSLLTPVADKPNWQSSVVASQEVISEIAGRRT